MFCTNCGMRLPDGAVFCTNCGTRVQYTGNAPGVGETAQPSAAHPYTPFTAVPPAAKPAFGEPEKPKKRKAWPLILALLLLVGAAVFVIFKLLPGGNSAKSAVAGVPELPDAFHYETYHEDEETGAYTYHEYDTDSFGVQHRIYESSYDGDGEELSYKYGSTQTGANGYMAVQEEENGEVRIYVGANTWKTLEAPVNYFLLSGDGKTLVYGTSENNTWKWSLTSGKREEIDASASAYDVSYDGSTVFFNNFVRRGNQDRSYIGMFAHMIASSEDGKRFYYREYYTQTSGDTSRQIYNLGFCEGGNAQIIFSAPDPDYDIIMITQTPDCKECLFSYRTDVYYFSMADAKKSGDYSARRVTGSGNGYLVALRNVRNLTRLADDWNTTVENWIRNEEDDAYYPTVRYGVPQGSIRNMPYLQLSVKDGYHSAEIVWINEDMHLTELIPYVEGNVCISDDWTKLWAVANGQLVFADLSEEEPAVTYCSMPGVQRYYPYEDYVIPSIAVTSDGQEAYYIGTDSALYRCTSDMPAFSVKITDGAFWVWHAADDSIFFLRTDLSYYMENMYGDLYTVEQSSPVFQHGRVCDILSTKKEVYIFTAPSEEDWSDDELDLYKKEGSAYLLFDTGVDPYYSEGIYAGE